MKLTTYILASTLLLSIHSFGQTGRAVKPADADSSRAVNLNEVIVSGVRTKVPLKEIPASISVVSGSQLNTMNKSIAADEIFRLTPGVRIDNGTDGSRVHFYIRGQGVLTESGFRGVGVLIDGIPVSDPAGFTPDL
ncbi:MAG TPA: Plug domain-containing protein, partial [Bacteroidales bacterium]|nr:Plug domain-containing protein [Bacteroidales bacterium]